MILLYDLLKKKKRTVHVFIISN